MSHGDLSLELWRDVVAEEPVEMPSDEEKHALRSRIRTMSEQLMTWRASDGMVSRPTVHEVRCLAQDIADLNTRAGLAMIGSGETQTLEALPGVRWPWGL